MGGTDGVVVGVTGPAKSEKDRTSRVERCTSVTRTSSSPTLGSIHTNAVIHMEMQKTTDEARLSKLMPPGSSLPRYRTAADERARLIDRRISMLSPIYIQMLFINCPFDSAQRVAVHLS